MTAGGVGRAVWPRRAVLAAAGALVATVSGCSSGPPGGRFAGFAPVDGSSYEGPRVTLELWNGFTGGDGPYFQQIVDRFNADGSGITVNVTQLPWENVYQKMPTAVVSGDGPDIAAIQLSNVATNAARQVIVPMDAVAQGLGYDASEFAPAVWEGGVYDGERYGIPIDVSSLGLFYNRTLLEQAGLDADAPPRTATEYGQALAALREEGVAGHWVEPGGFTSTSFTSLIAQFGGQLYSDDGREATWDSPEGVRAMEWLVERIDAGDSPANVGDGSAWTAFKQNQNAFVWHGIWTANDPDLDNVDWGVATLPVIGAAAATWADSHQFVATRQVSDDSDKQAAIAYFIDRFGQDSLEWARGVAVPARAGVRAEPEFQAMFPQHVFAEQIDSTVFAQPIPGLASEPASLLNEAINAAVLGRQSPQEALRSTAERARVILLDNVDRFES